MRPTSIVTFDRLYLVATGLGLVNSFMSIDRLQARIEAMPQLRAIGVGSGVIYGSIAVGAAISLLLWFAVAYKRSALAKWILVAFTALAILNLPSALRQLGSGGLGVLVSVAVEALRIVALSFLFRADAKAWFAGSGQGTDADA
jgi:hypothetical protein